MIDARHLIVGGAIALTGALAPLFLLDGGTGTVHASGPQDPAPSVANTNAANPPAALDDRSGLRPVSNEPLPLVVEIVRDEDGTEYATVVGTNVSIRSVLERIAKSTERLLWGFGDDERGLTTPLVTVELRDRPLTEVVEYMLGTAGLVGEIDANVINVRADRTSENRDTLLSRALAGYSRASYRFPNHELAAAARLAQGAIEELRGLDQAALSHYQLLIDAHSTSSLVLEAHMRSGALLQGQGEWARAIEEYRRVTELTPADLDEATQADTTMDAAEATMEDYFRAAHLEIARCNLELGHADWAIQMLNVLERKHPAATRQGIVDRRILRARCYLEDGKFIESLKVLDELERGFVTHDDMVKMLGLRARCFDALDLRPEAARAWVIHAHQVEEPERSSSFERAAEHFLVLEDYLGVLFLAENARTLDSPANVRTAERIARAALGLSVTMDEENSTIDERVAAARAATEREDWSLATQLLSPLFRELEIVPVELRDDVALEWSATLYATSGITQAIGALRTARKLFERTQPEDMTRLDARAGQLFEQGGRFDLALDAYDGNY
ncbi:hypothetical protein Pla163_36330 [Planctomycetes bacterium Pla163]|uniref:Uncharacterized protein n=1 Tax=Rohdeia mirabilis TaxID=2528008 RepID=A0A518D4S7_9BACT|nr:hypothetical protein Pla163_36330 [Planctomycetes bacterium Pla163]